MNIDTSNLRNILLSHGIKSVPDETTLEKLGVMINAMTAVIIKEKYGIDITRDGNNSQINQEMVEGAYEQAVKEILEDFLQNMQ